MKSQPIDPITAVQKIKEILANDGLYSKIPEMDAALKLAMVDRILRGVDAYVKQRQQQAQHSQIR